MPTKPVTVRRWEVAVGFAIYLIVLAGTLTYMQRSIDLAEKRIVQNALKNAAQDEVRRQLVAGFRLADARTCAQLEVLKSFVRPEPFNEQESRRLLSDLRIDPDSERGKELLERGRLSNARERRELAPVDC